MLPVLVYSSPAETRLILEPTILPQHALLLLGIFSTGFTMHLCIQNWPGSIVIIGQVGQVACPQ